PHCGTVLKAYGHPGITLHRAEEDNFLCQTCAYHADDTCNFPKRPHAKDCTLYQDVSKPQLDANPIYTPRSNLLQSIKFWFQRNPALVALFVLISASLLLAVISR
ncbi:MAG TPA: hypothetical protein DDW51_16020, partial [Cyanobacteria bacterium UBA11367]|nr:hypothetical protein [Cyanobacteria bacterium UBA11367]